MNNSSTNTTPNSRNRFHTPGAHLLPPFWEPTEKTILRLATKLAIDPKDLLEQYLPAFKDIALDRRFMYRNWNKAFSNCVTMDWPGVRNEQH